MLPIVTKVDIRVETFRDTRVLSTVLTISIYIMAALFGIFLLSIRLRNITNRHRQR